MKDEHNSDIAWCSGCGNFGILNVLKKALDELGIEPGKLVLVSGIGQAAKIPHYFRTNFVSVQADLAKLPDVFINDGTGISFK